MLLSWFPLGQFVRTTVPCAKSGHSLDRRYRNAIISLLLYVSRNLFWPDRQWSYHIDNIGTVDRYKAETEISRRESGDNSSAVKTTPNELQGLVASLVPVRNYFSSYFICLRKSNFNYSTFWTLHFEYFQNLLNLIFINEGTTTNFYKKYNLKIIIFITDNSNFSILQYLTFTLTI